MKPAPRILIIAGPNGAGKTTFAREYLLKEGALPVFINADLIAAGLAPFQPETAAIKAARLMLEEVDALVAARQSFAFETTLSGKGYATKIPRWQAEGYCVELLFLSLPDEEMALARVAARVQQGGHNIPEQVVRRRFHQGLEYFHRIYKPLVNEWYLFDNSQEQPQLVDMGRGVNDETA